MGDVFRQVVFGGGCFWCLDALFSSVRGVHQVVSGYAGGAQVNPSYEQVCSGSSGHAEVVQITFDPAVISLDDIYTLFFLAHNPTTLNRQGADIGTQYRSVIFTTTSDEQRIAEQVRDTLSAQGVYDQPIVTEIVPLPVFYPAETYHQQYFAKNPSAGYCQAVITPKLAAFRKKFADKIT